LHYPCHAVLIGLRYDTGTPGGAFAIGGAPGVSQYANGFGNFRLGCQLLLQNSAEAKYHHALLVDSSSPLSPLE